jgi:antitoxin component YwqK of YwqJK toxin-antitoxin module
VDGELEGVAKEYDAEGHLTFEGHYHHNVRQGDGTFYFEVNIVLEESSYYLVAIARLRIYCWIVD